MTWFTNNLFEIPGDEDGGGMTAFVVFSIRGFFLITPGVPGVKQPLPQAQRSGYPKGKKVSIK